MMQKFYNWILPIEFGRIHPIIHFWYTDDNGELRSHFDPGDWHMGLRPKNWKRINFLASYGIGG